MVTKDSEASLWQKFYEKELTNDPTPLVVGKLNGPGNRWKPLMRFPLSKLAEARAYLEALRRPCQMICMGDPDFWKKNPWARRLL